MALLSLSTAVWILLGSILFLYIRSGLRNRQFQRFAESHGAEPPVKAPPGKLPWNLDGMYKVLKAEARGLDIFDDILMPRFAAIGSNTFETVGLLGVEIVNTIEPANVQAILATNFKDWEVGRRRLGQFGVLLGKSIVTTDRGEWSRFRSLLRPQFTRDNINDLDATERASRILIEVLPQGREDGWTGEVDLLPLFYRFTLDTATAFLFGNSVNSQLAAAGRASESGKTDEASLFAADKVGDDMSFSEAFSISQEFLGNRIRLQTAYWLFDGIKYRKAANRVRHFANYYVKHALETVRKRDSEKKLQQLLQAVDGQKRKYSLVSALVHSTQDVNELRDQLLGLMVASRDTTANLLAWVFLLLSIHPRIFAKLRTAILDALPPASTSHHLNLSTLKSCRYLQYVINETLRIYPVVPVNNRLAVKDTILPKGGGADGTKPIAIRKGQLVNFFQYGVHRRKDLWGEDALEFRPERWEGRKIDWSYLPFSGGPRICLGQQYAITEASYLIVRLLHEFDAVEWCGASDLLQGGRPRKTIGITLIPKGGVNVRFRRAKRKLTGCSSLYTCSHRPSVRDE